MEPRQVEVFIRTFYGIVQSHGNSERGWSESNTHNIVKLLFWCVTEVRSVLRLRKCCRVQAIGREASEGLLNGWSGMVLRESAG